MKTAWKTRLEGRKGASFYAEPLTLIGATCLRLMQNTLGRVASTLVPNGKAGSRVEAGWEDHCRPCSEPHPISPHPCELIATQPGRCGGTSSQHVDVVGARPSAGARCETFIGFKVRCWVYA